MDNRLRIEHVANWTTWAPAFYQYVRSIEERLNMKRSDIHMLMIFDLNTPYARTKGRIKSMAMAAHTVAEDNPNRSMSVIILPDIPSATSVKGLQEDEDVVVSEFNAMGQDVDTRFAVVTEPDSSTRTVAGSLRGWSSGRLGVALSAKADKKNEFVKRSKLYLRGRPDSMVKLPAIKDLVHIESLSADADVTSRDKQTFSKEQIAAQKGIEFSKSIITTVMDGLNFNGRDSLLIIDFTPHAGDYAMATRELQKTSSVPQIFYLGVDTEVKTVSFLKARIVGLLAKQWQAGSLVHAVHKPQADCPALPAERIDKIPGARAAMGDLQALDLKVCSVIGGRVVVQDIAKAGFDTSPAAYREQYLDLMKEHKTYENMLMSTTVGKSTALPTSEQPTEADGSGAPEAAKDAKEPQIVEEVRASERVNERECDCQM